MPVFAISMRDPTNVTVETGCIEYYTDGEHARTFPETSISTRLTTHSNLQMQAGMLQLISEPARYSSTPLPDTPFVVVPRYLIIMAHGEQRPHTDFFMEQITSQYANFPFRLDFLGPDGYLLEGGERVRSVLASALMRVAPEWGMPPPGFEPSTVYNGTKTLIPNYTLSYDYSPWVITNQFNYCLNIQEQQMLGGTPETDKLGFCDIVYVRSGSTNLFQILLNLFLLKRVYLIVRILCCRGPAGVRTAPSYTFDEKEMKRRQADIFATSIVRPVLHLLELLAGKIIPVHEAGLPISRLVPQKISITTTLPDIFSPEQKGYLEELVFIVAQWFKSREMRPSAESLVTVLPIIVLPLELNTAEIYRFFNLLTQKCLDALIPAFDEEIASFLRELATTGERRLEPSLLFKKQFIYWAVLQSCSQGINSVRITPPQLVEHMEDANQSYAGHPEIQAHLIKINAFVNKVGVSFNSFRMDPILEILRAK